MKKSLLALAVLGGFAGVASAQSSVTLYGTVDLNGRYIKNDGSSKRVSLSVLVFIAASVSTSSELTSRKYC